MENQTNNFYNKKIDLELRKKKLAEKYDAHFGQYGDLSPELENEWLNNIEQFEQQFENSKTIAVWEYIGKPVYLKIEEIDPDKISSELEKLMKIMNEHNVVLDSLCPVDDKELYRFVTEELFSHDIENVFIEGMMTCFTYEEFHPNAKYDISRAYDHFFRVTMGKMKDFEGKGYDFSYIDMENFRDSKGDKAGRKRIVKSISAFLDAFDYFEVAHNDIKKFVLNSEKTDAILITEIEYKGCFNSSPETVIFQGTAEFRFKSCIYGGWLIYYLSLPGLRI